ncbi:triacylglycerol lipase [Kutzneria buriramensis]|uniref:esterase/lipase family protein n=1 Tax=Kutzneria buriramensis TaxID=1045776 RepID=UPI0011C1532A|nr:alpha/beta hydrolase [Kutzneria buriramensis]
MSRTHRAIAPPALPDFSGFVYGCVNAGVTIAGAVADLALTATGIGQHYRPLQATMTGRRVGAALNGAIGDSLTGRYAALATPMRLRHKGIDLPTTALAERWPDPSRHVIVMIHGLAENEEWWQGGDADDRTDFGRCLTEDLGASVLYVRYNSGRQVTDNGRELAELLADVFDHWPVPVERLSLVGHSMGGLVARSAVRHADAGDSAWVAALGEVICLGTPHRGSPVERTAEFVGRTLGSFHQSAPLATLFTLRSAGIKDLRHGLLHDPGTTSPGRQLFVAATLARDPGSWPGRVFGDLLVTPASATDPAQQADRHTFGGIGHAALLRHSRVYAELRRWLSD